jgi:hypothetical protein
VGATNDAASVETHRETALSIPCFAISWFSFRESKDKFCKRFAKPFGHSAILALPAPFRICNLQIPLKAREIDPVSGHHIFNSLQAHPTTTTFRNAPPHGGVGSTLTPCIVRKYQISTLLETRSHRHCIHELNREARVPDGDRLIDAGHITLFSKTRPS